MHHPQHWTARRRRGSAAARLFAAVLCAAVLLSVVHAIGGYGLSVVHAQAAEANGHLQTSADTVRRRTAAFLRGRSVQARVPAASSALAQARAEHLALAAAPQAAPLNTPWTAVGPLQVQSPAYGLVTGRITSVAIDPNDTSGNTVYIGTSGGGVWKSTNAAGAASAVLFHPLTDTLPVFSPNGGSAIPSLSIGAMSVQPGGTGVVLAGTGDPNDGSDSYYGEGLLRSTDGGTTWALVQQATSGQGFYGEAFAGFAWSTASPQTVVAALSTSAEAAIVRNNTASGYLGLFYSQDGGTSWLPSTIQDGSTVVQDRNNDITNFRGNAATSVVWNPVRQRFYAAVRSHGYYESADGVTFTRMANQPGAGLTAAACPARPGTSGSANCPIFRGVLAAQPVSGDLFALTVDAGNNDQGLWQDTCNPSGGACASSTVQWRTHIDTTPMETGGRLLQGNYNLSLTAVPAATALSMTDTLLFAGTEDLFRCGLSGGCSLRNTTNTQNGCAAPAGVAPSQHAIAWQTNPSNSSAPLIVLGNDGGLWRSLDGVRQQGAVCSADDRAHFDNLNGALGSLAMVSGFSSHPSDPNVLLAALGENGSAASTSAAQASDGAAWTQLGSGESGTVAIDQSNGQTWLVQSGAGVSLHTCTNGPACTAADFAGAAAIGSAQVQADVSLADAPALLDPGLNTNVIAGTCRIFRGPASGGSTWSSSSSISRFLAGPAAPACTVSDGYIRSLAAGGPAVITNGSQNSGSTVLYAGLAGGADGGSSYGGQIYVNTAANVATSSTAWTNIAANSVTNDYAAFNAGGFDISSIAVDPGDATGKTVYATVMGFGYPHLYRSTNAGATWTNISANLPNAPANSVVVDPNNPLIVYVALDTGVYVATDVTSCVNAATGTTGNCWGVLGTSLPNAPVLSLLASKGVSGGVLRAGTFGRGIWQTPLLSAGQALAPVASFSPASLTFSTQAVGSTTAAQTVTLTNTGNSAFAISSVSTSADFFETDNCSGTSLTVNASCTFSLAFQPAAEGAASGSVLVYGNVSGGYATLPLSGTGRGQATVTLAPAALTFASTAVGGTSAAITVQVNNRGAVVAALSTPTFTGDFGLTGSTCGATLAPLASCSLSVVFRPTVGGVRRGVLSVADAQGNHATALSGNGIAGALTVTPSSMQFADTALGGTTAQKAVVVVNTGNAALTINSALVAGDYAATGNCAGTTLAAGTSCTMAVTFSPTAIGARPGTLTFAFTGASSATTVVTLSGNGTGAFSVVLTPTSEDFGTQLTGTTSAVRNITVSNTGTVSGSLGNISVTGDFKLTANTCGTGLPAQTGCTVSVVFTPTAAGARGGALTVMSDAGTQTATLTGIGTASATDTLSPLSLTFGSTLVNTNSATQTVTLTNSGDTALTLVSAQILAGDFTAVNGCGPTLPAHSACGITVAFAPKSVGALTGTLQVIDVQHSQTVTLTGTAIAGAGVSLLPASLTFANTGVGAAGAAQTLTLTNNGGSPLTLSAVTISGDFGIVSGAGTCAINSTVAAGASCTLSISFLPSAAGMRTGSVVITGNAPTETAQLNGTGIDFQFVANGDTTATIANGGNATFPLLIRPLGSPTADPVTYTCTGAPANASCKITSQYSDLSATGTVSLTVLTGTTTAKRFPLVAAVLLPLLLGPVWMSGRHRLQSVLAALLAVCVCFAMSGCGSGRAIADSGSSSGSGGTSGPVTPNGNYTIVAGATAAGVTHTVSLTLVVK